MATSTLRLILVWILRASLIIWVINLFLFVILILFGFSFAQLVSTDYFSKATFLETGLVLLVGGAIAFSGSVGSSKTKELIRKTDENWSIEKLRMSEKRANKFFLFALILFVESIALSFLGL
jgi:hypothetical protein